MALSEPATTGELFITRAPTVVSLQQLLDDEPVAKLPSIALNPDQPVAAVAEAGLLPLVSFAASPGIQAKRVRSFGDLMVVPDVDVDDPRHALPQPVSRPEHGCYAVLPGMPCVLRWPNRMRLLKVLFVQRGNNVFGEAVKLCGASAAHSALQSAGACSAPPVLDKV